MSSRRGSSSAIWATCASCRPVATALAPKCGWKRPPSATDGSCLPEDTLRLLPSCSQSASHGLPSSRDYSHVVDRRSPAHMSKRPLTASAPAEPGDRVRLTAEFERTQLLGILFGEFARNPFPIENRLGVYISAR